MSEPGAEGGEDLERAWAISSLGWGSLEGWGPSLPCLGGGRPWGRKVVKESLVACGMGIGFGKGEEPRGFSVEYELFRYPYILRGGFGQEGGPVTPNPMYFFSFFLFFFFSFYIMYSLLRYKNSHGALAMA